MKKQQLIKNYDNAKIGSAEVLPIQKKQLDAKQDMDSLTQALKDMKYNQRLQTALNSYSGKLTNAITQAMIDVANKIKSAKITISKLEIKSKELHNKAIDLDKTLNSPEELKKGEQRVLCAINLIDIKSHIELNKNKTQKQEITKEDIEALVEKIENYKEKNNELKLTAGLGWIHDESELKEELVAANIQLQEIHNKNPKMIGG